MKLFLLFVSFIFSYALFAQEVTPQMQYEQSRVCLGLEPGQVDHAKGFELLKAAFNAGYKPAAYNLAICYLDGIGCKADWRATIEPFLVAYEYAKETNDEYVLQSSTYGLAQAYYRALNGKEALRYYKEAYEMGVEEADLGLAFLYYFGVYEMQNEEKAKFYFKKAVERGSKQAKEFVEFNRIEL